MTFGVIKLFEIRKKPFDIHEIKLGLGLCCVNGCASENVFFYSPSKLSSARRILFSRPSLIHDAGIFPILEFPPPDHSIHSIWAVAYTAS